LMRSHWSSRIPSLNMALHFNETDVLSHDMGNVLGLV
jgi:hypothetical protein